MFKKIFSSSGRVFSQSGTRQFSSGFSLKASRLLKAPKALNSLTLFSLLSAGYLINETLLKTEEALQDFVVGETSDLPVGQMKEVKVGPEDADVVLVANVDGTFYCVSSKCTHFGFGLSKGVLIDDKVICPLHSAAFSVVTGYPESGPVLNGLNTYEARVENNKIIIRVPKTIPRSKELKMAQRDPADKRVYLVLGGGVAGLNCAETLRQSGFTGEIVMISDEKELPYDRTILTKSLKTDVAGIRLRSEEFFKAAGIQFMSGSRVSKVEQGKKQVVLENGKSVAYDKLCIATGSSPNKNTSQIPGATLKNVSTYRDYLDLNSVRSTIQAGAKNVVVAGGSFIGMELAASIKSEFKDQVNVTVIVSDNQPYAKTLGPEIGGWLRGLAEKTGVHFTTSKRVKSLHGSGTVREVELSDGSKMSADLVLLGTGVKPNSSLASGVVSLDKDGGIPSNAFMQVGGSGDVFCAGDVCSFPYYLTGQRIRVEHYSEAMSQGVTAAWNMLGKMVPYASVPFFWTRLANTSVRYSGWASTWDKIHIDGSVESGNFMAYYIKDNKILAVADVGRGNDMMMLNQAMKMGLMPPGSDVISGKVTAEQIKQTVLDNKKGCKCQRKNLNAAPPKL